MVELQQFADPELWAAECRRRRMLSLQGIDPLISRFSVQGAAVLPRFSLPEPSEPHVEPVEPASAAPLAEMTAALRQPKTPAPASSDSILDTPVTTAANSNTNQEERVRFSLLIAKAGSWIWIESLPDALVRREQLQLLQGMARAVEGASITLRHHQFDWPLADHVHLPADLLSARQSVSAQLKRLAREGNVQGWVIMGEEAQHYVEAAANIVQLIIPSTLAMLAEPDLKKQAWQRLKPYVRTG